jgi:perosamine synthetase
MPSKMDEILAFAKRHKLFVIEDASHAHGAVYNGTKCGKFGDISVFSLQGDKLAPAGEGGVLMTDDYGLWERAVLFGDVTRIYHLETESRALAATSFGIKTRMAPVSAAIGISQLKKLSKHNKMRNQNIEYLSGPLEKMGFETFLGNNKIQRTYFEFLIKWKNPQPKGIGKLIEALQAEGTRADNPRYPLLHQQPFFTRGLWQQVARLPKEVTAPDYSKVSLPRTEMTNNEMLRLPHFSTATKEFMDSYIAAFEKVISNIGAIYK